MRTAGTQGGPGFRPALLVLTAAVGLALAAPEPTAAQPLADRVATAGEGRVVFRYATRPDVRICSRGIRMGEHTRIRWHEGYGDETCRHGPAEVELRLRDGRVRDVELLDRRSDVRGARDLGTVEPREAVTFLASLARGGAGSSSDEAVFPLVVADVEDVWMELEAIAVDRGAPGGARKNALFWLGQEAAEAAVEGLREVATADREEQEVREAAVFALSQRPESESVPVLMELARTAPHPGTRKTALFWLAQSEAPEVVEFFADILRGRDGG